MRSQGMTHEEVLEDYPYLEQADVCILQETEVILKSSLITLDICIDTRYNLIMIKSFCHKGVKLFFETGSKAGIQAQHANKLARQLLLLNNAKTPDEMNIAGWRFHALSHNLSGHYAIWVDKNWRLTFRFDGEDAELVDYQDYH